VALTDSLVAYWSLEEASGSRADATGRGNTLSETGTPGNAAGIVSNAANLDDANYLSLATNSDLSPGNVDFTWAFWFRSDVSLAGNNVDILGKWAGGGQLEYDFFLNSGALSFLVSSTGSDFPGIAATSIGTIAATTWYYVVAWHDSGGNTLNICVNDGTVDSTGHSAGVFQGTATLLLAKSNFVVSFDGRLDEVGLWHRVLTSGEITQLYNGGAGLAYASFGSATAVPVFTRQYRARGS
jgi:hypothetical protein